MKISYKKLWHLLIDRGLNKQDLRRMTGISTASIAKLGKGENITTDILVKICEALECDVTEIMSNSIHLPLFAIVSNSGRNIFCILSGWASNLSGSI